VENTGLRSGVEFVENAPEEEFREESFIFSTTVGGMIAAVGLMTNLDCSFVLSRRSDALPIRTSESGSWAHALHRRMAQGIVAGGGEFDDCTGRGQVVFLGRDGTGGTNAWFDGDDRVSFDEGL
jgi:hypothetical protein